MHLRRIRLEIVPSIRTFERISRIFEPHNRCYVSLFRRFCPIIEQQECGLIVKSASKPLLNTPKAPESLPADALVADSGRRMPTFVGRCSQNQSRQGRWGLVRTTSHRNHRDAALTDPKACGNRRQVLTSGPITADGDTSVSSRAAA